MEMRFQKFLRFFSYLLPLLILIPIVFDVKLFGSAEIMRKICFLILICAGLYGFLMAAYKAINIRDVFIFSDDRNRLALDRPIQITCRVVSWSFIVSGAIGLFVVVPYLMVNKLFRASFILFLLSTSSILLGIIIVNILTPKLQRTFGNATKHKDQD